MDCMDAMRQFPDGYFDLAVVDPPYGIGVNHSMGRRKGDKPSGYKPAVWDSKPPDRDYFNELFRVSKNQVIWGGNYMTDFLYPSPCWLIWDKMQEFSGAVFEMAWSSFQSPAKAFRLSRVQAYVGQDKVHPTQKPVKLYEWIYMNYLPRGGKVLDTHLGSGSNRIAADKMGNIEFYGYEIDKDYFDASVKRFEQYKSQLTMF